VAAARRAQRPFTALPMPFTDPLLPAGAAPCNVPARLFNDR
jgi:hypothetical protein